MSETHKRKEAEEDVYLTKRFRVGVVPLRHNVFGLPEEAEATVGPKKYR